jgi:PEGA domain
MEYYYYGGVEMLNSGTLKKATFITLFFFIWFSLAADFKFAAEKDKLTKAREKYEADDYQGSIRLLESLLREIKTIDKQKRNVAEALYLMAQIAFKEGKDKEMNEHLRETFEHYPLFNKAVEELDFEDSVKKVRRDLAASYYSRAKIAFSQKKRNKSDEYLKKAFSIWTFYEKEESNEKFLKRVKYNKKEVAESFYLMVRDHYKRESGNKNFVADENLKKVFILFPAFNKEERHPDFIKKITEIREKMAHLYYDNARENYLGSKDNMSYKNLRKVFLVDPTFSRDESNLDFRDRVETSKKKLADEHYNLAVQYYGERNRGQGRENLRRVFWLKPGYPMKKDFLRFEAEIKQIKRKVAGEFYKKAKGHFFKKNREKADTYIKIFFNFYPKDYREFTVKESDDGFKEFIKRNQVTNNGTGADKSDEEKKDDTKGTVEKEGDKGKRKKKKFPLLLVAGGVVLVGVLILLLTKKKKQTKQYILSVDKGTGVDGNPGSGSHTYNEGSTVSYNYSLQDGYSSLVVTLDGNEVSTSGSITMDRNHQLIASTTALGSIYITTDPTGAKIFLDGSDTGKVSNAVIQNVVPGSHTIRLELQGYDTVEEIVQVSAGSEARLDRTLNRSYTNSLAINGQLGVNTPGTDENTGQDAYRFYVGKNCTLTVTVTSQSHMRPEYAFYAGADAEGNILESGAGRNTSFTYIVTGGQYYSFAIEDETPDVDEKAGTYTITITSNEYSLGDYEQIRDEASESLAKFSIKSK